MIEDITFTAEPQGKRTDDDKWEHYLWQVTIGYNGRTFSTEYRMGTGLVDLKPISSSLSTDYAEQQAKKAGGVLRYNALGRGKDAIAVPRAPTLTEVLSSLALDARLGDQLFEDFCDDLGYDSDSRKAFASYEACQRMHYELRNLFGAKHQEFMETDWEDIECSSS